MLKLCFPTLINMPVSYNASWRPTDLEGGGGGGGGGSPPPFQITNNRK